MKTKCIIIILICTVVCLFAVYFHAWKVGEKDGSNVSSETVFSDEEKVSENPIVWRHKRGNVLTTIDDPEHTGLPEHDSNDFSSAEEEGKQKYRVIFLDIP